MEIEFLGTYKSLNSLKWTNIPKLAVITGPNGSGKTQLLELIYESLTSQKQIDWSFTIGPSKFAYNEVVRSPN